MNPNRDGRANFTIIIVFAVLAVAASAFLLLKGCGFGNGVVLPPPVKPVPRQLLKLAEDARQLQSAKNIDQADKKWKEVENKITKAGSPPKWPELLQEAKENRKILEPMLSKTNPPTDHLERDPEKIKDRPAKIERDDLLKYYKAGRTIRSSAEFVVSGEGSNEDWGLKGIRHFVGIVSVVTDTTVLTNDGHRVTFEVAFKDVSKNLVLSDDTLELALPDSPFLESFGPIIEREVLDHVPAYRIIKRALDIAGLTDPHLKRTLTALNRRLKRLGVPITNDKDVEYISIFERLAGARIKLVYVDGLGVVSINVLDGLRLPPEDLEALAESSGPMLDYFVFPGASKKPGDKWDVRAQDVASLIRLGYQYTVAGTIDLERDKDEQQPGKQPQAILKVVGGGIKAHSRGNDKKEQYELVVDSGFIKYSVPSLLATKAVLHLRFTSHVSSLDHLLFRMQNVRIVQIEAHYLAERKD